MKKIVVIGSKGRMGTLICEKLKNEYEIIGIDKGDNYEKLKCCDLAIDFSTGENSGFVAKLCAENHLPLIIGATGQTDKELIQINDAAKHIPILMAGNFSVGIIKMKEILKSLKSLEIDKIIILESHHNGKKDKPSGTAKELSQTIENELNIKPEILSIRGGEEIGTHEIKIYFGSEVLTFSHIAFSRQPFVNGLKIAIKRILNNKTKGLYSLTNL